MTEVKILLLEENQERRVIISAFLRHIGYEKVVAAADDQQALKALGREEIELAICAFPSGQRLFELVKRLEAGYDKTSFLLLADQPERAFRAPLIRAGADEYLDQSRLKAATLRAKIARCRRQIIRRQNR